MRHISKLQRESLLFLSAMSYQTKAGGAGKGKKEEEEEEMVVKEEECSGKVVRSAICIWEIRVCPHLPRFYSFPQRGKDTNIPPVLLLRALVLPFALHLARHYLGHKDALCNINGRTALRCHTSTLSSVEGQLLQRPPSARAKRR